MGLTVVDERDDISVNGKPDNYWGSLTSWSLHKAVAKVLHFVYLYNDILQMTTFQYSGKYLERPPFNGSLSRVTLTWILKAVSGKYAI